MSASTKPLFSLTTRILLCSTLIAALPRAAAAGTQDGIEAAREAITTTDYLGAIRLLEVEISGSPSPDAYFYLGLAHAHLLRYERALEVFDEGFGLYPSDSRFLAESAGVHIANRNFDLAVAALERALGVNPGDSYAADLLASIRLSQGEVRGALEVWNTSGQPRIDAIFQNFSPGFLDRAVPRAVAFGPGDRLTYERWKTTESRLLDSRMYTNVGIVIEPSPEPDLYNAIVQTTRQDNSRNRMLLDLVRGLPIETAYLDAHNLGGSGIGWRSSFRWDDNRRRFRARLTVPLPIAGLPIAEFFETWRSERWNLDGQFASPEAGFDPSFDYKVNAFGFGIQAVPHYQATFRGGLEFRNRDVTGSVPGLGMDGRNSAVVRFGTTVRPVDTRYRSQILLDGFVARESFIGDFDFSGAVLQWANRWGLTADDRTLVDFGVTAGTARGELPVDHYFVLGLGSVADYRLRAHVTSRGGRYGSGAIGTDFVLFTNDVEHRLVTVPLFGSAGIPFVEIKAVAFWDAAKVFDRLRIFEQGEWLNDVGTGLRFETPTTSFNVHYGRDTSNGDNVFYGYVERRFW